MVVGANVSQWTDLSGNGNHLLQATGAAQPAFSVGGGPNSISMISGDGVAKFLSATLAMNQPQHIFCLCKFNAAFSAPDDLLNGNVSAGTGNVMRVYRPSATNLDFVSPNDLGASGYTPTAWHWLTMLFSGAASTMKEDAVLKKSGDVGASAATGLNLFATNFFGAAGQFSNSSVAELIGWPRALSAKEELELGGYLAYRAAL